MLNIKGLRLSNRSSTGKYEYRDCFISKSICGDWFVAAALVGVKIPTGRP